MSEDTPQALSLADLDRLVLRAQADAEPIIGDRKRLLLLALAEQAWRPAPDGLTWDVQRQGSPLFWQGKPLLDAATGRSLTREELGA